MHVPKPVDSSLARSNNVPTVESISKYWSTPGVITVLRCRCTPQWKVELVVDGRYHAYLSANEDKREERGFWHPLSKCPVLAGGLASGIYSARWSGASHYMQGFFPHRLAMISRAMETYVSRRAGIILSNFSQQYGSSRIARR